MDVSCFMHLCMQLARVPARKFVGWLTNLITTLFEKQK
jgi:hypothetical protein